MLILDSSWRQSYHIRSTHRIVKAIWCTQPAQMDSKVGLLSSIATPHNGWSREFRRSVPMFSIVLLFWAVVSGYVWESTSHHLNPMAQLSTSWSRQLKMQNTLSSSWVISIVIWLVLQLLTMGFLLFYLCSICWMWLITFHIPGVDGLGLSGDQVVTFAPLQIMCFCRTFAFS